MKKKKLRKLLACAEMQVFDLEVELHNAKAQYEADLLEQLAMIWDLEVKLTNAKRTIESHKGVKFRSGGGRSPDPKAHRLRGRRCH